MQKTTSSNFDIITKIQQNIKNHPDKKALIFPEESITFKRLDEQSGYLAHYLQQKGIQKGDRIVVMIPISPTLFYTIFALIKIGATVVFIDHHMSIKNIENSCKISDPKAFIGNRKANLLRLLSKSVRKIPIKITFNETNFKIDSEESIQISKDKYKSDSLMFIRFTTGSTGFPKGVERTYQFMCNLFKATHDFSKIKEKDIDMTTYPMNILYNLVMGTTSVFPSSDKPEQIVKQMLEQNVTTASGPPQFWEKIVKYCKSKKITLDKIHFIFTGGDPVSLDLVYGLKQTFPKSKTNVVYGSTEVFPISWIDIDEIIGSKDKITKKTEAMCLGKPHPNLQIKIVKSSEDKKAGEIIISGSHVVKTYFGDEDGKSFNQNKIVDKNNKIWHRTGDLGYLEKNEIWFVGRMKK